MHLSVDMIMDLDRHYRRNLINSLPGPRGVHLIGTKGHGGTENLGVFSSVVHLGAAPPLLGFVLRPLTVPRHTYHHLQARGHFSVNTIHPDILGAAHQASANYDLSESEFTAVGLTPEYTERLHAPYVRESLIKIGCSLEEEHRIAANDTLFIVGRVIEIQVPDRGVSESGSVDHERLETLAVSGLDTYLRVATEAQLGYARP